MPINTSTPSLTTSHEDRCYSQREKFVCPETRSEPSTFLAGKTSQRVSYRAIVKVSFNYHPSSMSEAAGKSGWWGWHREKTLISLIMSLSGETLRLPFCSLDSDLTCNKSLGFFFSPDSTKVWSQAV